MSSLANDTKSWDELLLLKKMTETTGVLHDAQVLQLKHWPLLLFEHAKRIFSEVSTNKHSVHLRMTVKDAKEPTDVKDRYVALDTWIKRMLGDHWALVVYVDYTGQDIYNVMFKGKHKRKINGRRKR